MVAFTHHALAQQTPKRRSGLEKLNPSYEGKKCAVNNVGGWAKRVAPLP